MHIPVLLNEVLENLDPKPGEFFIDGTINGGGHAKEILKKIEPNGILLGTDLDEEIIKKSNDSIESKKAKVILVHSNYADLLKVLKKEKLPQADGLLLDLGFSSEQLESPNKGFSFLKDEVLDMRYDTEMRNEKLENRQITAAEVVNSYSEKDLADIFYKYGEERLSRRIAKVIIEERRKKRILTTLEFAEIIKKAVPKSYERGRIHPATRTFQALRIYINQELENLQRILGDLDKIIKPNGIVAIISFHSLEDRIVKHFFKQIEKEKKGKIITKKPIIAKNEEIKINPRSRSAKLRVIQIKSFM
ncbi:16S rRNA (cytosine(1402)-N(4))-methyltransferase [Candidatus Wolfebacteria bacterium CG10_big_fil_rev_8_21_14_0_10_31_9]|uniref:Ribosomal RNA small subunit methyltransferase H n=1 Tax=Candidatus Wolfebacteria bacterium CG10_big_fil_rev_8_21_14_0_10_31_9 TaxID=1975070 RepID=A0A2H0RCT0_9BACT|nr:MAG: 16S rRNA (cytosine(1402)-N(4))-methyltransferase [Candidatus Wolfebacteria bacterium CG10_big_fil_rev_8_21_14_0_10_31_9]